jgi:hypothetical protein
MSRRTETGACVTGCMILAILCALAPSALAKTYEVSACNYAPEAANNSWVWSTNDPAEPAHYASHTNCPYRLGGSGGKTDQEGGLSTTDALGLSNGAQPGTNAGWTFTTPTGTTITAINYERYIGHIFDSSNDWSPALRADGTPIASETCLDTIENSETCFVGGPPGHGEEPAIITGLSAQRLTLGIDCQPAPETECVTGATQHKAWATMYGARVAVNDSSPPTLGPPTGPLWEPGKANGFHKGSESVTISANDIGGGVQSIALEVDGKARQTYNATCDFTFPQPCPTSTGSQILTLATTELSDGAHTVALVATDAADNQSTLTSEQITVDNDPPSAPTNLKAIQTQPGGTSFNAEWADPPGQASPIATATYQVCPASGPGICRTPAPAPAAGPSIVTVPGPGTWTLAVWLTDVAGNSSPASAAYTTLTVPSHDSGGGNSGDSGSTGGGSGNSGGSGGSSSDHNGALKATVRLTCVLHGRELVVRVSGPAIGRVRVGFTGRLRGRIVASGAKTINLMHSRSTATFKLGPRTAAHALIRVSAKLGHELAVSTLHRAARRPRSTRG